MLFTPYTHASDAPQQPAPASIYAALQAQRNKALDEAAIQAASNGEHIAALEKELAALKKDFGVGE